jgi:hypothetical protein
MMRTVAACLAASLAAQILLPAVCASAQAAESFAAGSPQAAPSAAEPFAAGSPDVASVATPGSAPADTARPATGPFEVVTLETPPDGPHRLAWASLLTGVGLIGLSFALTARANDAYDDYLVATDPARAEHLYDRTKHYDRLSAASLLTGEALVATAVWLRFLHHRPASRLTLVAEPDRCAVALRF